MLSVGSKHGGSGGGEGADAGEGAGEHGGDSERVRNSGNRSNRDVTRSRRSIRLSSSDAGLWVAAAASASLPVEEIRCK